MKPRSEQGLCMSAGVNPGSLGRDTNSFQNWEHQPKFRNVHDGINSLIPTGLVLYANIPHPPHILQLPMQLSHWEHECRQANAVCLTFVI